MPMATSLLVKKYLTETFGQHRKRDILTVGWNFVAVANVAFNKMSHCSKLLMLMSHCYKMSHIVLMSRSYKVLV